MVADPSENVLVSRLDQLAQYVRAMAEIDSPEARLAALDSVLGIIGATRTQVERKSFTDAVDPMTGVWTLDFLNVAIESNTPAHMLRTGNPVAVISIDVCGLKYMNDRFGNAENHDKGDQLLAGMATRVKSAVRTDDIVARRKGGDEMFVIAAVEKSNPDASLKQILERIKANCNQPMEINVNGEVMTFDQAGVGVGGVVVQPVASAGVWAELHEHGSATLRMGEETLTIRSAEDLLRPQVTTLKDGMLAADEAMYVDKKAFRLAKNYESFDPRATTQIAQAIANSEPTPPEWGVGL